MVGKFNYSSVSGVIFTLHHAAHTGEKIERASHFQATQHETLVSLVELLHMSHLTVCLVGTCPLANNILSHSLTFFKCSLS